MSDVPARTEASTLQGWGMVPAPGREIRDENLERATAHTGLSRGLGRSSGDSSLPPPGVTEVTGTVLADRILAFDAEEQRIRVEAGFPLHELIRLFLPRGLFTPVTPGTKFVTVGGMVASDVHGKNHHRNLCFGEHVRELTMRLADDSIVTCGPETMPDLFWATVGGMGLTGHILEVEFDLERAASPWIFREQERIADVETFILALKEAGRHWPYTVGWIDCVSGGQNLGRGILDRGRWAHAAEAPRVPPPLPGKLTVPWMAPNWALNWWTARIFNALYYWKQIPRRTWGLTTPDQFFYPLDAIHHWNRLYGRRGFTQYQCVLPETDAPRAARQFLEILTHHGGASPLCVIKDCGPQGRGLLSFPFRGISIAVDLWLDDRTQALVDRLNDFVVEAGGRIYLTKDTLTRPDHFAAMYGARLEAFQAVRHRHDPDRRFRSAQSVRVLGDPVHG